MLRYLALLALLAPVGAAYGEIPDWVRTSAGWWADGSIPESEFLRGIEFLVGEGIIAVGDVEPAGGEAAPVPDWVRSSAGWWAQGVTSDSEFVSAIEHLISVGVIAVGSAEAAPVAAPEPAGAGTFQAELDACEELKRVAERSDCIGVVEKKIEYAWFADNSDVYEVGPVTFYYPGIGTEGNEFFFEGDQPILTIRMLAENTGSDGNVALACTGPSVCSYDVWDGSKAYKFSGMDFTSGQIVLRPGDSRVFNMLFGPNIGYGGTTFEYDGSREYSFRISEPWGEVLVPLDLR